MTQEELRADIRLVTTMLGETLVRNEGQLESVALSKAKLPLTLCPSTVSVRPIAPVTEPVTWGRAAARARVCTEGGTVMT